jgi:hypothetical protein
MMGLEDWGNGGMGEWVVGSDVETQDFASLPENDEH